MSQEIALVRSFNRLVTRQVGALNERYLGRRSDELAASVLEPLTEEQRARLLRAQAEVRRLLAISMIGIAVEDPTSGDAKWCLGHYFEELRERFEERFDPTWRSLATTTTPARLTGSRSGSGRRDFPSRGCSMST